MEPQGLLAMSPGALPSIGSSSHEEIEASKTLNKYLSPISKSTRIQTQDFPSRKGFFLPYL